MQFRFLSQNLKVRHPRLKLIMKSAIRTVNPPPTTAATVTTTTPTITSTMNAPTTTIPATPNMPRLHTGATSSRTTATFTNLDQFQSPSVPRSSHGENYTWVRVSDASTFLTRTKHINGNLPYP